MKNAQSMSPTARDADETLVRPTSESACGIPFQVQDVRTVSYGSKCAEFRLLLDGVEIECDLFAPPHSPQFIVPSSVRDKYTGGWRRTARLDDLLAAEVLAVVIARLNADAGAHA